MQTYIMLKLTKGLGKKIFGRVQTTNVMTDVVRKKYIKPVKIKDI